MYVLYGDMGLLGSLSILIFMVVFLFLLASISAIQITLAGVAGIIIALGLAVDAHIITFQRIKDEYRNGKRLAIAVENGFNKTVRTTIDANATAIVVAAILYGTGAVFGLALIQGFAITFGLGILISSVCSLWFTRSFAKNYLYINSNNEKRLRLDRKMVDKAVAAPEIKGGDKPKTRSLNLGGKR